MDNSDVNFPNLEPNFGNIEPNYGKIDINYDKYNTNFVCSDDEIAWILIRVQSEEVRLPALESLFDFSVIHYCYGEGEYTYRDDD